MLLEALDEIYYQWSLFATQLVLRQETISNIDVQGQRKDLQMCLQGALEKWFAMDETPHTWWLLSEAVKMCDNLRLAVSLRTKYRNTLYGERHPNMYVLDGSKDKCTYRIVEIISFLTIPSVNKNL